MFWSHVIRYISAERTIYLADAVILCTGGIQDYGKKVLQEKMKILEMDII